MNAAERWTRFQDLNMGADEGAHEKLFAVRGDGAVVLFDEDGWFTLEYGSLCQEEGCERHLWIFACDPDGTRHDVYCEPVWFSGFVDSVVL